MNAKVLSLGSIYFEIDSLHYPLTGDIPLNREFVGNEYQISAASSALTFAKVCASLGLESEFLGKMGNDIPGRELLQMVKDANVRMDPIISDTHQTNLSIHYLNDHGDFAMFNSGNANESLEAHEIEEKIYDLFPQVQYVYIGGVFKLKALLPKLPGIVEMARKNNVLVVFDHNRITNITTDAEKEIVKSVIAQVDYYFPSKEELLELLGLSSLDEAIEKVKSMTNNFVIIKDADNGAIGIREGGIYKVPAFKVQVLNSIGAGDSFNAGFVRAQVDGMNLEDSIKFANATAALKISKKELPTYQEVNRLCQTS